MDQSMRKLRVLAGILLPILLAACTAKNAPDVTDGSSDAQSNPPQSAPGPAQNSPSRSPAIGITSVADVKVTPATGDKLQLRGASTDKYRYSDLMAVLYCRAWQFAQANGYNGAYPLRFHKLKGGEPASAHVAVASVQMFRGAPDEGKSPLGRSWCSKTP
jgi:hypothetical protein